jgi:hypothetical protein
MSTGWFWTRSRPVAVACVALYAAFGVCCGFFLSGAGAAHTGAGAERAEAPKQPAEQDASEPICRIRFLTREERLHPDPAKPHLVTETEIEHPYPDDQADNPVLLQDRFAVTLFENTTSRALRVYLHGWALFEEDPDALQQLREMQRAMVLRTRFKTELGRQHALKLIDAPRYAHPAAGAFFVDVEVRGSDGEVIRVPEPQQCLYFNSSPPTAEQLRSGTYPTRTLKSGERIEFALSILGKLRDPARGLKPGSYTVRVTVSYAEVPSGETRHITSEPVTVTVTEDDIRAAEAYWEAAKN